MRYYNIPLTPEPQSFGITLAGTEYRLTIRWFDAPEGGWTLDIQKPDNAEPIILSIPLVAGCDLLEQYDYLDLGGELWIEGELPPALENLGTEVELVFVVLDEEDGEAV